MKPASVKTLLSAVALAFAGTAQANPSNVQQTTVGAAREGVVRCGSNHFFRTPGFGIPLVIREINYTAHSLKNFDPDTPIKIDRIRMFNALGTVIFDSADPLDGMPTSTNGLLGPGNDIIGPTQTANLQTTNFLPLPPPNINGTERPLTFEVSWSSEKPALLLHVGATRIVREFDRNTGDIGRTIARSAGSCRNVMLR